MPPVCIHPRSAIVRKRSQEPSKFILILAACLLPLACKADVILNEIMANGSERLLRWSPSGVPKLGFGTAWYEGGFNEGSWQTGNGPFGFGSFANVSPVPSIGTNVATQMQNLTPTLYLRKTFTVSAIDAAKGDTLNLEVRFNDGFVCYLNGVEVARRNAGAPNSFVYRDQFAAFGTPGNTEPSTRARLRTETLSLGTANTRLLVGTNTLAVHALNHWETSTLQAGGNEVQTSDNQNNFYFSGDLKIAGGSPVTLVSNTSAWRYLPGVVEPSGGLYDPALLFQAKQNVAWGRPTYDDSAWSTGAPPFGVGPPPGGVTLGLNLTPQIQGIATSLYLRIVFTATAQDLADPNPMQFSVDWDDGFVAYINGVEVVRDQLAEANSFTPFDAVASGARAPGTYFDIALDTPARLLVEGQNVLAVQLHNASQADVDLFFRAYLKTNRFGIGRVLIEPTYSWKYRVGTSEPIAPANDSIEDNPEAPDSSLDWVELHNNGITPVSLANWKLSDDPLAPAKWQFPANASIPAGGYLIVACDGANITAPPANGFYHTNFKLSSTGETLLLSNAAGVTQQQVTFGSQTAFESYGRDSTGNWVYHQNPSPAAANTGGTLGGRVSPVTFSLAGGFYSSSQAITLSTTTSGATLRYTTDGSEPTETTGAAGTSINVTTSVAIRARAFKSGQIPSLTTTRSYLINEPAARQGVPALSIAADQARSLYRPFGVMAINGGANPTNLPGAVALLNNMWTQTSGAIGATGDLGAYNNPIQRGRFTERPANMELLRANGTPGPNIEFGLRISGSNFSRPRYLLTNQKRNPGASPGPNDGVWDSLAEQKPSFNLFFRNDFGGDPLEYPLFPNYPVNAFRDIRLRAGKNDISNPFIVDEFMRRSFINTGQKGSRGMLNTLYVNGVYKGYYNLCERLREDFFQRHHGGGNAWDVRQVTSISSGDGLAFQEMITYLRNSPQSTLANFRGMKIRLDMVNFIDYLIVNLIANTGDWVKTNYIVARERKLGALHRYYMWDAEGAFGAFGNNHVRTNMFVVGTTGSIVTGDAATADMADGIQVLYTLLRASPEFKLLFADRLQKHLFNNGALAESRMIDEWNALKAEFAPLIAPALINDYVTPWFTGTGNSARYTITGAANAPSRRNVLFSGYNDDTAGGTFIPGHLVTEGLWPTTAAPALSQFGGTVAPGSTVAISNPNSSSSIYFTTNGNDPRAEGGGIQGTLYSSPLTLQYVTTLKARVRSTSGQWSPLIEAQFITGVLEPLLITELMYHPADNGLIDGDEYEFIEIKNTSSTAISLSGMKFTSGISYTFPAGSMIGAGQHIVLPRSQTRFIEKYPTIVPIGEYGSGGTLSNSGENVTLVNANGSTIFSFTYSDIAPWVTTPDGAGPSLVPVNADSNPFPDNSGFWRASNATGGSPGADDPTPLAAGIFINEVLANPLPGDQEKIELYNSSALTVDLSDWWLSDSDTIPQKFRIPAGTSIPGGGYLTISETAFATATVPFNLSSNGERARISSGDITGALTGYFHSVDFGASNPGESFGPYLNSRNSLFFVGQKSQTFGDPNSGPRVGPLVISELMYNPPSGGDEFIEMRNISAQTLELFDPENPGNSWRMDGLTYSFPSNTVLQPGQVVLLTPLTPSAFRSKYSVPAAIEIFGPYTGALDNGGERIRIRKPGLPYLNDLNVLTVPLIEIDSVNYDDVAPWPTSPDGNGRSLERINLAAFADDVANWQASPSNGGTLGFPTARSFGGWLSNFFSPTELGDSQLGTWDADPDGDGLNNFREWVQGSDPMISNADSVVQIIAVVGAEQFLELSARRSRSASGAGIAADISPDLNEWSLGAGVQIGPRQINADGTETLIFRNPNPLGTPPNHFMRLRFNSP